MAKYILHIKQKWFICMFSFMKSSSFVNICEKITNQHSKFLLYYQMVYYFIRGGISATLSKFDLWIHAWLEVSRCEFVENT